MPSNVLRVYIETSVISGYGRERFHDCLMSFFDMIRKGVYVPIISEHTINELYDKRTPPEVIGNLYTIDFDEVPTKLISMKAICLLT